MKALTCPLAAISIALLAAATSTKVLAGTIPTGQAYVDVNAYYSQFGDTVLSYVVQSDGEFTGNNSDGGYIYRDTFYTVTQLEVPASGGGTVITSGQYFAEGYVNYGLLFNMPNWNSNGWPPFNLAVSSDPNINLFFGLPVTGPGGTFPSKPPSLINFVDNAGGMLSNLGGVLTNPSAGPACTAAALIGCVLTDGLGCGSITTAATNCKLAGQVANLTGNLFKGIAADPVDSNYQVIATPGPGPGIIVFDVPGSSPTQETALTDLVSALNDVSGLPGVIQDSFNRAQGAYLAGDQTWESLQLFAAGEYAGLAESDINRIVADAGILGIDLSIPASVPEPGTLPLLGTTALFGILLTKLQLRPRPAIVEGAVDRQWRV
jgi:hypothetical protein